MKTSIKIFSLITVGLILTVVMAVMSGTEQDGLGYTDVIPNIPAVSVVEVVEILNAPMPTQPSIKDMETVSGRAVTVTTNLATDEYVNLSIDIITADYNKNAYDLHTFDCTDMSAILCTHLDALGWDAHIITLTSQEQVGHAMVVVYGEDRKYLIESAAKKVTHEPLDGYKIDGEYTDVVDAVENSRWGG